MNCPASEDTRAQKLRRSCYRVCSSERIASSSGGLLSQFIFVILPCLIGDVSSRRPLYWLIASYNRSGVLYWFYGILTQDVYILVSILIALIMLSLYGLFYLRRLMACRVFCKVYVTCPQLSLR